MQTHAHTHLHHFVIKISLSLTHSLITHMFRYIASHKAQLQDAARCLLEPSTVPQQAGHWFKSQMNRLAAVLPKWITKYEI